MSLKQLSLLVLGASLCVTAAVRADDYSDRINRMQELQEQADRDRVNYSRVHESETNYYAAIAYSPASGNLGSSYSYESQASARRAALSVCQEPDARIVAWSKNCYCALAVGKDGYGAGFGSTANQARAAALSDCAKQTTGGRVVKCVFSGSE